MAPGNGTISNPKEFPTLVAGVDQEFKAVETPSLKKYDHLRITSKTDIPVTVPTVKIGSAPFAAPGNLSALTGQSKVGKSGFLNAVIAGSISKDGKFEGFEDIHIQPNIHGKAVIQIDTEQAPDDHQFHVRAALKRCKMEDEPSYFLSYNFNLDPEGYTTYRNKLEDICALASKEFGGIFLIIVDGGADFLSSVNDDVESRQMVHFFTRLAIKHKCPVITVIHQNPGSEKERGHFGSEVQRKCYALFSVSKNGDVSTLEPKLLRKAGFNDSPLIFYRYDAIKGFHVSCEAVDQEAGKAAKNRAKIEAIAREVFAPPQAFKTNEAIRQIAKHSNLSESTAKRYLKDLEAWEVVQKHSDEFLRLNVSGVKESGVKWGQVGSPF